MPLMQLSTLVLPAPLGPMSANSSPLRTARETLSSTLRPPKRSDSRSSSSSAIPAPAAAVLFDIAVAASLSALVPQIEFLNVRMAAQALGGAVQHDLAVLHDVAVIRNLQGDRRALLDHQNGDAELAADIDQPREQIAHHDRRQAKRQLVHQQQSRSTDNGAPQRQHLALAAGEQACDPISQLAKLRKETIDQRFAPLLLAALARNRRDKVLGDSQVREYLVALGHEHNATRSIPVRKPIFNALAVKDDRARRDAGIIEAEEPRDGTQGRGLAGAVGPEQRDDLGGLHRERNALHGGDAAMIDDLEPIYLEQAHRRDPAVARRCLYGQSSK